MVGKSQDGGGIASVAVGEKRSVARSQVARALETRIRRGEYAPGTWLPTERALAEEFSVDRSTVRAALTELAGRDMIVRLPGRRPWVRDDFLPEPEAADGGQVRTPQRPALKAIAAVLPQHPHYPAAQSILRGLSRALRQYEAPHRVVVFDTFDNDAGTPWLREGAALEAIADDGIGAVLLWHIGGEKTLQAALRLRDEQGVAVIFVDRCPENTACDFVGVDNRSAAREAVEHLLALGHRRVACLSDGSPASTVRERVAGYREAILGAGVAPDPDLLYILPGGAPPAEAVRHFRTLAQPPTALFTINDLLAHHFIAAFEQGGAGRVPADLSVVGFDDLEQYSPRPALLTTMSQPFERVGERAAELALRRMEETDASGAQIKSGGVRQQPFQHVLLPAPLVVRATTAPSAL